MGSISNISRSEQVKMYADSKHNRLIVCIPEGHLLGISGTIFLP